METLWNAIVWFLTTLIGVAYTFLIGIADLIPLGRLLLLIGIIVLVWFYVLPRRVKNKIRPHLAPAFWTTSTPLRWLIVQAVANKEWLRQSGDAQPTIVEVPVETPVRMRRSFRSWAMSQLRTVVFTCILVLAYQHWETIRPLISR